MRKSGFENRIGKLLKKNGITLFTVDKIDYNIPKRYTPDFKVGDMYIETKGYFRPSDRTKMRHVKLCNPELDIRLWFQKDEWLDPKTKATRYSEWAEKYGFPFHVGEKFPEHWFEEMRNDCLND